MDLQRTVKRFFAIKVMFEMPPKTAGKSDFFTFFPISVKRHAYPRQYRVSMNFPLENS
jgi:hypothetical protein